MSRNWTENQKLAIDSRDGSILVSAAAGSGKTAALVERVCRRITEGENPTPVERVLIVTFTKAATAELQMRISDKLREMSLKNPGNPWYRRQLLHLPFANICTADSFCGNLVKEFSSVIGVETDYRIADESEVSLMKRDAMKATMEQMYGRRDVGFLALVETFASSKSDSNMELYIEEFYKFLRSHPFEELWLKEKLSYYDNVDNALDTVWGKEGLKFSLSAAQYCLSITESSLSLLETVPKLHEKLFQNVDSDRVYFEKLIELLKCGSYDEIRDYLSTYKPKNLVANEFKGHPVKDKMSDNRSKAKASLGQIKELFINSEKDAIEDIRNLRPIAAKMFETVLLYSENFAKIKRSKKVADFEDVVHWALNILVDVDESGNLKPSKIAGEVSDRFDEVMVDEYQDANEVQDLIYHCLSHEGKNLFVVGDVKQSIYGFRQAMPEIFLKRKNSLPLYSKEKNNYPSKVILEKNFRSRKEVTDYINFVFSGLMSEEIGDLVYNDEEKLVPEAPYEPTDKPCAELHLLDLSERESPDQSLDEATYIAELIHKMCKETYIKDGDSKRLVRYGDIAVIMRNTSPHGPTYANRLKKLGVPAMCDRKLTFVSSEEITLALNFLKIIDNPLQDIPLAAVMMSPLYGFTPDDMAGVRCAKKGVALYSALIEYGEEGNEKAKTFLSDMNTLRNFALTQSSDEFINTLYDYTNLPAIASAAFNKNAEANLNLLVSYAKRFEQGASKGIASFVDFISRLEVEGKDLPAAVESGEAENSVTIMTIHSSKGLEFPICIIANTHRPFRSNSGNDVLIHSHLGFASTLRDNILGTNYSTFPRNSISFSVKKSEMSEEMRVLYVAMTRAKERLIMVASDRFMKKHVSDLASSLPKVNSISPFLVRDCTNLSDWLIMSALIHPDATNLREYADMTEPEGFSDGEVGKLSVTIVTGENKESEDYGTSPVESTIVYEAVPDNVSDVLKERFDFRYSNAPLCDIPQKVTASELAHKDIKKKLDTPLKTPKFMTDVPLSATERGTALHLFLEHCDYLKALESIETEIQRLYSEKVLSSQQVEVIDKTHIKKFINSEIVSLALKAKEYMREYKFTVNIPAKLVREDLDEQFSETPVVLEGAVDLLVVDEEGIIVVDYKTDRVDDTDALADMYSRQLYLYKNAIEQIFKKPVKRCLIYSVYLSEIKEV